MIVYSGTRLYGRVDEAPELFYVATMFWHLWFLPLIPLRSYLVLRQEGRAFEVKPIPLSWKSVVVSWLLAVSLVASFFALPMAILSVHWLVAGKPEPPLGAVPLCALCLGACWFLRYSKVVRRGSYERARELAAIAELTPEGTILLELIHGRIGADEAREAIKSGLKAGS